MTRYAVLDTNSGFVWGAADADSPCDACRIVDETEAREYCRAYREISRSEATDSGYIVYAAPEGWACDDGQDEAALAEVAAMPIAAYVAVEG